MKEKKTFILAVPTVIIIIVFLIAMPYLVYRKNYKPLSREQAVTLSKKVLSISNISCEIITQNENEDEKVEDYKFKDNVLLSKYSNVIELTDGNDNNRCTYLDLTEKSKYIYNSPENIEKFKSYLNVAIEVLEDENYDYEFLKYEKMNGIKAAAIELSKNDATITIWLDRESGMPIKMIEEYNIQSEKEKQSKITTIYRYQIGKVDDDALKLPDTTEFETTKMD